MDYVCTMYVCVCARARTHKHGDVCVCPRPNVLAIQTLPDGVNPFRDLIRDGTRTSPEEFLVSVRRIGQARFSKLCGSRKSRSRRSSLRGWSRFPRIGVQKDRRRLGLMLICIDYRMEIEGNNNEMQHEYISIMPHQWNCYFQRFSIFKSSFSNSVYENR